jgi:hypothetical protein
MKRSPKMREAIGGGLMLVKEEGKMTRIMRV